MSDQPVLTQEEIDFLRINGVNMRVSKDRKFGMSLKAEATCVITNNLIYKANEIMVRKIIGAMDIPIISVAEREDF